jgi:hypothetical protein
MICFHQRAKDYNKKPYSLVQSNIQGRDIKPTRIIKGKDLANVLTEGYEKALELGENDQVNDILNELENNEWYSNIIYYLKNISCPNQLVDHKRIDLILKVMRSCLTQNGFGWKNPDGRTLRRVNKDEANNLVEEFHSGLCRGTLQPIPKHIKSQGGHVYKDEANNLVKEFHLGLCGGTFHPIPQHIKY